jgi:beta-lactam-binding protein with PASTA domain
LRWPARAAKRAIGKSKCTIRTIRWAYFSEVTKGRVISQRPRAGKHLKKGAKVNLVVGKGKRKQKHK